MQEDGGISSLFDFLADSTDKIIFSDATNKDSHVPVIHRNEINAESFRSNYLNKKPVKLKGFMNQEWTNWTPDSLCELFKEEPLSVLVSKDNKNFIDNDITCERAQMTNTQLFDHVFHVSSASKRLYFRTTLPDALLESVDQLPIKTLLDREKDNTSLLRLWVGSSGNVTPIHYDRCHGVLSQIIGTKKITLFSPKYTSDIYPHESHSSRAHCSRVCMEKWIMGDTYQREHYPNFDRAKRRECILEPGDILYTPPGWWHHVLSVTPCASITVPFDMKPGEKIPPNMLI
ncbi:JmjC domain-containing protein [Acrasis kona]|uniref:JmjC domain-containing protein n=1 Tax=Acrasis kona TaxID=1008807 RepID=A0AAW2YMC9_9EUKA